MKFWRRLRALLVKEFRQLWRDPGNLFIGLGLPLLLILIFGYGLSLDVRQARVLVVLADSGPAAQEVLAAMQGSPYLQARRLATAQEAEAALLRHEADAWLQVPVDYSRRLAEGRASLQLQLHGGDPARAMAVRSYVEAGLALAQAKRLDRQGGLSLGAATSGSATGAQVQLVERLWFNAANQSTWYLVPGLVVLIMTLVGTFLTALVLAREWERGTLEALFVTPVRPGEVLLAKLLPYFVVGMFGQLLCLAAARWLFQVPLFGSLWVLLLAGALYMLVSVGMGLLISALTRNQFIASQVALLASFMPTVMLSGFLFDLRNVPLAPRLVGQALPASYFMQLVKTLFLAGDDWALLLRNGGALAAYALFFLLAARLATRKRLD